MTLSDYDYQFPESSIALFPPEKRGTSKLFVIYTQTGEIVIDQYENLDKYLTSNDVLVRNTTKVFHARLFGNLVTTKGLRGKRIEVFITEPHAQSLDEYVSRQYDTKLKGFRLEFLSALRSIKPETIKYIDFGKSLRLVSVRKEGDAYSGVFLRTNGKLTVDELFKLFEEKGKVPLPPYIKRDTVSTDDERYQTIFAKKLGSVAAPTASLNFTKSLEKRLIEQGTAIQEVILHVGRGTFMPLRHERVEDNILHAEPFFVHKETLEALRIAKKKLRRVIAMGTTATRTLETIAPTINSNDSLSAVMAETRLFVYPPYQFQLVDGLLTNFHFPKSSLITLVDAFLRWKNSKLTWRQVYVFAIEHEAKLFSYGDSMLIL